MNLALAFLATLAAGYALGRIQPARRASNWANWQRWGQRPTGIRYVAVWTVLSIENISWLIAHPVRGARAWKRRNDSPPPRSPAPAIRRVNQTEDQP